MSVSAECFRRLLRQTDAAAKKYEMRRLAQTRAAGTWQQEGLDGCDGSAELVPTLKPPSYGPLGNQSDGRRYTVASCRRR